MSGLHNLLGDEARLLKISATIALLLFAGTLAYSFVLRPLLKSAALSHCLQDIQDRKETTDKANAARIVDAQSAYEKYQIETGQKPDAYGEIKASVEAGITTVNVKQEQDECYRRYK